MRPTESFIEQPIRSLQTMLRVIAQDNNSIPTVVPDGIYGPGTMQSVSAVQRNSGLPVTGITDQPTWEQIVLLYEPALIRIEKAAPIEIILDPNQVLRKGESSPYIYLLQSMLTHLAGEYRNIPYPTHTGVLDDETSQSLAAFQLLAELPITGELDKITWKYLVNHFTLNANHTTNK